jgi:hypothetical protein
MSGRAQVEPFGRPAERRKFSADEDNHLRSLVEKFGTKCWDEIARFLPDRTTRQCRDRYKNYLMDSLVTEPWRPEEDAFLIKKYHEIGPKWVEIGKLLSGRSGNNVKNRWHKHLCKLHGGGIVARPAALPEPRVIATVEEKRTVNLSQAIGLSESDWSRLFAWNESLCFVDAYRGFSVGETLF